MSLYFPYSKKQWPPQVFCHEIDPHCSPTSWHFKSKHLVRKQCHVTPVRQDSSARWPSIRFRPLNKLVKSIQRKKCCTTRRTIRKCVVQEISEITSVLSIIFFFLSFPPQSLFMFSSHLFWNPGYSTFNLAQCRLNLKTQMTTNCATKQSYTFKSHVVHNTKTLWLVDVLLFCIFNSFL